MVSIPDRPYDLSRQQPPTRRPRFTRVSWSRVPVVLVPIAGSMIAIAGWWLATIAFEIRPLFLPAPPEVIDAFRRLPGHLLRESWTTLAVTLGGFAIAVTGGLGLAIVLTASRLVQRAILPTVVAINAIPKVALVPLLILWLGRGQEPKLAMVVLISFFPIVVSTMAGLMSTPADLGELARSLSGSRWQTFSKIRFPWALPQIFVGLKVGMPLAMIGAVVAEIANPNAGLGSVIVKSGASLDTPLAFAAISMLAAMSVSLFYLIVAVERLLLPWARSVTAQ